MDTKWNSTKALAGFLAFFLGVTLVISSLGAVGNRLAWERDPSPRWETDWQNTAAFRDQVSQYLREFLTIGAGGEVDFYSGEYWEDYGGDVAVVQEEAARARWGFYPITEAVVVDRGTAEHEAEPDSSDSDPAKPEKEQDPDERYRNDKNVLYFIETAEGKTYTNTAGGRAFFLARAVSDYNFYLSFQDGRVSIVKDGKGLDVYGNGLYNEESQWFVPGYDNFPVSEDLEGVTVYMAARRIPQRYYGVDYKNGGTYYNSAFYSIAQSVEESQSFYRTQGLLLFIAMWCLVLWFALRKSTEPVNKKIASWTVRVWTEIRFLLVLCPLAAFLWTFTGYQSIYDIFFGWGNSFSEWGMAVLRLITMNVPALVVLFWFCWLIHNDHKYNPKEVRRSLLKPFLRGLRARDLKRPVEKRLSRRAALMILAVLLLGAETIYFLIIFTVFVGYPSWLLWTICFLPMLLLVWAAAAWARGNLSLAKDLGRLADQVEAVRAGDLERPLKLPEDADLRQTAESLNDIQAGMKAALEEQTRSERMKVELVSNVSHDLKTPLTSILSYAELLRQEEDLPPAAADYAKIIDQKAHRLKTMVEDVFEISRAAADQLPVHLERLDLGKLLRQTLADMDGPIQAGGLTFKVELPERAVMITADGRRLYRVFQNLLDNALRYALEGSRVYLSLKTMEGSAEASVRNTSHSELPEGVDFTARFVRGDASRTDGGSGLGLSIAKSFTEACGGSFRVETVADLFTAIVTFPVEEER